MPFIKVQLSCPLTKQQETDLKQQFGKAIAHIPGKNEDSLLLRFEDNCRLWLRGENDPPVAYIEAAVFGAESHAGFSAFTRAVTEAVSRVPGIAKDRVYIRFEDIPAWSVGGQYIDRRMFG